MGWQDTFVNNEYVSVTVILNRLQVTDVVNVMILSKNIDTP